MKALVVNRLEAIAAALVRGEDTIVNVDSSDAGRTISNNHGALDLDGSAHFSELRTGRARLTRKNDGLVILETDTGLRVFIKSTTRVDVSIPQMGLVKP